MKTRFLAAILGVALTQVGTATSSSAQDTAAAPATASVIVTTTKRTNVRVGSLSLPLTEGSKLEVLGREGSLLVVKFRSSKGKVPAGDTDFNAATTRVPEIAPEPAADVAVNTASNSHNQAAPGSTASSNKTASANQPAQPAPKKPARPANPSAPPPPVGN